MNQSITVLLSDGRLIDARLPSTAALAGSALAGQYVFGDQVTITCKDISPVWDADAHLAHSLELQTIKFLRRAEPQEIIRATRSPDWRRSGNLLPPPPGPVPEPKSPPHSDNISDEHQALLEKARVVNLERASHLPNFIADEEVSCYVQTPDQPIDKPWMLKATIRSEVTFKGGGQSRQRIGADGKPDPSSAIPAGCIEWSEGYAIYFKPLFDPACGTAFTFSKTLGKPGAQAWVYNFSASPESLCFGPTFSDFERAYATHDGAVLIDIQSGDMISVAARSSGYPKAFPIMENQETLVWNVVRIEGESHLLPVSYERVRQNGYGGAQRVTAVYSNHRHFEASSSVTYK